MEIEDVIFLGAGASCAEGASPQSTLFRDFLTLKFTEPGQLKLQSRVRQFLESFFGVSSGDGGKAPSNYPTFEEVLGILDLALLRGESFKGLSSTPSSPEIQQTREDLVYLMAVLLDEQLKTEATVHRALVNRLGSEGKLLSTAFVSSNYDILIDNALIDAQGPFDCDLSYGIEFTNFDKAKRRDRDWDRPRPGHEVRLYKLHGSLNWLYCPACVSLTLIPKEKPVAKLVFQPVPCKHCRTFMTPIVIPPTFFKDVSNPYLQRVWLEAGSVIREAKRLFFCGYSFPDADLLIKYLIKRGEMDRGGTPQVFVINRQRDWETDGSQVASRYLRFFTESRNIHLTRLSFEDFSSQGVVSS
jgi:hypothetical protein